MVWNEVSRLVSSIQMRLPDHCYPLRKRLIINVLGGSHKNTTTLLCDKFEDIAMPFAATLSF